MAIDNVVLTWNQSASHVGKEVYSHLLNTDLAPRVRFLEMETLHFSENIKGIRAFDKSSFESARIPDPYPDIEGRIALDDIMNVLPQSTVFSLYTPNNAVTHRPEQFVAPRILGFLKDKLRQGVYPILENGEYRLSDPKVHDEFVRYLEGITRQWNKNARRNMGWIVGKLLEDWDIYAISSRLKQSLDSQAWNSISSDIRERIGNVSWRGAKHSMETILMNGLDRESPMSEIFQQIFTVKYLRKLRAASITVVPLYYAFGRSDRPHDFQGDEKEKQKNERLRHEVCLTEADAEIMAMYGVKRIITVAAHSPLVGRHFTSRGIEFRSLSGIESLVDGLSHRYKSLFNRMLVIGPDLNSEAAATELAIAMYNKGYGYDGLIVMMDKTRKEFNVVEGARISYLLQYKGDGQFDKTQYTPEEKTMIDRLLIGRTGIVTDDIIDTASTYGAAVDSISGIVGCQLIPLIVHPVLSGPGVHNLTKAHNRKTPDGRRLMPRAFVLDTVIHRREDLKEERAYLEVSSSAYTVANEIKSCAHKDLLSNP
ncbi:hypothetical protein JW968_06715 [Candidatus Woesearchaeota archaeon]|nr:hypothetical protein [Candidatus Woesearchaeota archaeon]